MSANKKGKPVHKRSNKHTTRSAMLTKMTVTFAGVQATAASAGTKQWTHHQPQDTPPCPTVPQPPGKPKQKKG
jgi:hypothetical protein